MKNYILGSDILGAEPSDEVGATRKVKGFDVADETDADRAMFAKQYAEDVKNAMARGWSLEQIQSGRFGPVSGLTRTGPETSPSSSGGGQSYFSTSNPAGRWGAGTAVAARGCHANGMTIWHYLFFAVVFAAIFFAPRIFVYAKRKFFSSPTKTDLVDAMPSTTEGRTS